MTSRRPSRSQVGPRAALAGILLAALALLAGCDGQSQTPPPQPPPPGVTVAPVTRAEINPVFEVVGQTEAVDEVDLRARVQGFLVERAFDEGDDVRQGALLFAIEKAPYEAALAAAAASVDQAEAAVARTKKDLERARILFSRGNVSEKTLDDAVAAERDARAQVAAAEARQREARLNLGYTDIYAPIDGRIGRAAYSVGNLVGPDSDVLATLVKLDPIYAVFNVSERLYLSYKQGAAARAEAATGAQAGPPVPRLRLANNHDYPHAGQIAFVDNRVDPMTGTIAVRAIFPNPEKLLVPGIFVTVRLSDREPEPALLIPQAAVQEDQAGRFVLVAKPDNTAEVRRIATGERSGVSWQVTDGLSEGELVIYEGIQKVRPGSPISPVVKPVAG
ncbi:MAG: efflux RND transporter periplasmic adaptor subunit [Rhodospirillales bacterium]|nr:efflux RND transporter periplasmic adaptor subunit [Rhodospirillales bacterium]